MNLNVSLYKTLYLLRMSEVAIQKYYPENDMKTPMHMSMGSEAIAVGVCSNLNNDDQILCTYRSHAPFLAKTSDVKTFFCEMYGKLDGSGKGKSGSMHLCAPEVGHMGSSAIVGSHIPVGVGCAFSMRYNLKKNVCVVFFGDAATDEGGFWESLNAACLYKLPVVFVCENNGLAVHTKNQDRRGYDSLESVVEQYNCGVWSSDSTDVEDIYNLSKRAIERTRKNNIPSFLHLSYHRYLEHVGIHSDKDFLGKTKEQSEEWLKRDPILLQRNKLLNSGIKEQDIQQIESAIDELISSNVEYAKNAPFAEDHELMKDVYCDA